ncbi:hypothetical protein P3396_23175, partial [Vibrio parahaemolyticus]|nr:hypothetical protein [Vibrio parahaemolyticus]
SLKSLSQGPFTITTFGPDFLIFSLIQTKITGVTPPLHHSPDSQTFVYKGAFRPRVVLLWSESGTTFVIKLYNCLELVRVLTAAFTSGPDQMPCARKLLLIGQNFHAGKTQEVNKILKKSTLAR